MQQHNERVKTKPWHCCACGRPHPPPEECILCSLGVEVVLHVTGPSPEECILCRLGVTIVVQLSGPPVLWSSSSLVFQLPGLPALWSSSCLVLQHSGPQPSCPPDFWSSSPPVLQLSGLRILIFLDQDSRWNSESGSGFPLEF